jgi:hypothetical protein
MSFCSNRLEKLRVIHKHMEPNYTWIYSDVDEWKYILGSNYSSRKYWLLWKYWPTCTLVHEVSSCHILKSAAIYVHSTNFYFLIYYFFIQDELNHSDLSLQVALFQGIHVFKWIQIIHNWTYYKVALVKGMCAYRGHGHTLSTKVMDPKLLTTWSFFLLVKVVLWSKK